MIGLNNKKLKIKKAYQPIAPINSALGTASLSYLIAASMFGNEAPVLQLAFALICGSMDYVVCKISNNKMGFFNHAARAAKPYVTSALAYADQLTETMEKYGIDRAC